MRHIIGKFLIKVQLQSTNQMCHFFIPFDPFQKWLKPSMMSNGSLMNFIKIGDVNMKKNVVMVIANEGFQPIEYGIPKKILENAGYGVTTASNKSGIAVASDNSTVKIDSSMNDIDINQYAALIFIGGPGALERLDNESSYTLLKDAAKNNLIIGAICITPRILAHAGILTGKTATGWDDDDELRSIFNKYDVTYEQEPVVTDKNIITAVGPSAAEAFGNRLVELLNK